jgi:hypothetical protein
MRSILNISAILVAAPVWMMAAEPTASEVAEKHRDAASEVADRQDELSADVQQLTIEQTVPKVIELLSEVEDMMDEATDQLAEAETGGMTIAAQTEVIEKIHEAAKAKQQQSGSGASGSAMMDMMERMMGKESDGEKKGKGKGKGKGEGQQGGQGQTGDSDSANSTSNGEVGGELETRTVPKASGSAGRNLPEEFNRALDAYNRGAEKKAK